MSKHTKGEWEVDGAYICSPHNEKNAIYICTIDRDGMSEEEADANACLIAMAPKLLSACQELASIFPEESMSEMDAADFKDRASRIWVAAQSAKIVIAKIV